MTVTEELKVHCSVLFPIYKHAWNQQGQREVERGSVLTLKSGWLLSGFGMGTSLP